MHDYILYSIAAIIGFIIYLDVRKSDKEISFDSVLDTFRLSLILCNKAALGHNC